MKTILILLLFMTTKAFALDAVVTVLEAPMFKEPNYDAPVVQYLRKGDVIKIHPSIGNDRSYERFAPNPEKYQALKKKMQEMPEWKEDPLFRGLEENTFYIQDEFIPTLDRQGHMVYVLSEHLFVYFGDSREFSQIQSRTDKTDYRLEEPLPRNYPLSTKSGYRGQVIFGVTQPYFESYPYKDSVRTQGYQSPIDANVTLLRQAPGNYQERLFIGGTFNARAFSNSYTFSDRRISVEEGLKFGLGPTISYDAFKGEKNRVNLSGSIIVNFFNQIRVVQSQDSLSESRDYRGYSLSPRLHLQYHRKQILEDIDFVLGTSLEVESAATMKAQQGAGQSGWWKNLGEDQFRTGATFTISGYLGIQSAY